MELFTARNGGIFIIHRQNYGQKISRDSLKHKGFWLVLVEDNT